MSHPLFVAKPKLSNQNPYWFSEQYQRWTVSRNFLMEENIVFYKKKAKIREPESLNWTLITDSFIWKIILYWGRNQFFFPQWTTLKKKTKPIFCHSVCIHSWDFFYCDLQILLCYYGYRYCCYLDQEYLLVSTYQISQLNKLIGDWMNCKWISHSQFSNPS